LLIFASFAAGQQSGTVKGKVRDKSGPAAGAIVTVRSIGGTQRNISSAANAAGDFEINDLPPGKFEISAAGNRRGIVETSAAARPIDVVSGSVLVIDLLLGESPVIKESVTVAAGESQPAEQVSKSVDVITGQEMRDRADFALVESLRTIPGFRVQQLGGFGRTASIKTRGLRNQDTAVLIDGIRFRDASAITGDASAFLSDFTLTSVSKVEVLRGSGSSLYGTDAVGGTVDFQTPRPRTGTHGQLSGAFGGLGLGRFRGNISHGTDSGRFGINAGVSRTVYTKGIDGDDDAHNTNFQTRLEFKPFSSTNISGRIFYSDAKAQLNSDPDTVGALPPTNSGYIRALPNITFSPDINDPDNLQRSRFFSGQLVLNQIINDKLFLGGYYQGLATRRRNDNGPLGVGFQNASTSIFDGTIQTANVNVNWAPSGKDQVRVGYEFERERFHNEGRTPGGNADYFTRAGQHSDTLYLQDIVSLIDGRLQFAGGARVQRFGLSRPEFSLANAPYSNLTLSNPPTALTLDGSASYFFRKTGTKLRSHIGNGYRVPSLYERFGSFYSTFFGAEFIAIGDPFLKPEKTIAFDAALEQYLAGDRVHLTATYFYTRLNDIIGYGNVVPDIGTTTRPFGGYENQKGGTARGGEFSGNVALTRSTEVFASYTVTNSRQLTPQVTGSGVLRTLGIPDHQFTLVATQHYKRFWVNFDFLATSDYLAPIFSNTAFNSYVYQFSGNRKGDLTAGYTFGVGRDAKTLRLYGTIENVFDNEYYENGFRTAGATARIGLTFAF